MNVLNQILFYGINKFVRCCVRDSILSVEISRLKIEENWCERNVSLGSILLHSRFFPILWCNIAWKTQLFIGGSSWNGFDGGRKMLLTLEKRLLVSWIALLPRSLKCILNFWEKKFVARMRERSARWKMTILACLKVSRDLEHVENSKREIDNTIRQWKFNAIAIRWLQTPRTKRARAADDTFPGTTFSVMFLFSRISINMRDMRDTEITGKGRCRVRITAGKKIS